MLILIAMKKGNLRAISFTKLKLNLAKSLTFPSFFFLTIYLNIKNKMYTLYTYIPVRAKKGLF